MKPTIEVKIQNFIEESFLVEFDEELNPKTNLFVAGVIDSFGYIQLIKFLEKEFDIKFDEDEILTDIPTNLEQMIDLVLKYKDLTQKSEKCAE